MRYSPLKKAGVILIALVLGYLGLGNFVMHDLEFQQAAPPLPEGTNLPSEVTATTPEGQLPCATYREHRKDVNVTTTVPVIKAAAGEPIRIDSVVDGDTLTVTKKDGKTVKVRLIGIDTPETYATRTGSAQVFGKEASQFAKDLVTKAKAQGLITYDVTKTDKYGRDLAYIWLPAVQKGTYYSMNGQMVNAGFAYSYSASPKPEYVDTFLALMRQARTENRGLWSVCQ